MTSALLSLLFGQLLMPGANPANRLTPAPVVFRWGQTPASGVGFVDTPNTVLHCYGDDWSGSGNLTCSIGGAWTQNGTVPQTTTGALYPHGFGGAARNGWGPFSDSNYWSQTSSPIGVAPPISICVAFNPATISSNPVLLTSGGGFNVSGLYFQLGAGGVTFATNTAGGNSGVTAIGAPAINGLNVACGGQDSSSINYVKANLGTLATVGSAVYARSSTFDLGKYTGGAGLAMAGTIYELWASTDPPSDALFTAQEARVFGLQPQGDPYAPAIADSRSSVATDMIAGTLYTWPAGVARVDANGLLSEPAATNLLEYSGAIGTAPWAYSLATWTANAAAAPDGTTTATEVTASARAGQVYYGFTSAGGAYSLSVWARWTSAQTGTIQLYDLTAAAAAAQQDISLTTSWQRFSVTAASIPNGHSVQVVLYPTEVSTGGAGSAYFWGAQLETGAVSTSYVATTGTTATRTADAITATLPGQLAFAGSASCDYVRSPTGVLAVHPELLRLKDPGGGFLSLYLYTNANTELDYFPNGGGDETTGVAATDGHAYANWDWSTLNACVGTGTSGQSCRALAGPGSGIRPTQVAINGGASGNPAVMSVKNVCVGLTSEACQ